MRIKLAVVLWEEYKQEIKHIMLIYIYLKVRLYIYIYISNIGTTGGDIWRGNMDLNINW
jgi:hypothetical protein